MNDIVLYMGNLPFDATQVSVADFLRELGISVCPAVVHIPVRYQEPFKGRPRGIAIIALHSDQELQRACLLSGRRKLGGRNIYMNPAGQGRKRSVHGTSIR